MSMAMARWWAVGLAALVLAGPAGAEEGVTDTEIRIGQWGPQTGPAAPWGAVARGAGVLFQLINDEGGIHGRKIRYQMFDDGYNPAKTKAGVKELQEGPGGIFAWVSGVGTAPGLAVRDYLRERKVPWVGPASGSHHWVSPPEKNLFALYPLYRYEAAALVRYLVGTGGKKRVAIAYLNDDYGKDGVAGAAAELARHGLKLVAEVPVEKGDSDLKPHVLQLKKAEPDAVLLWVTPTHAVGLVGTGKAMGLAPQWASTSSCSDLVLMHKISKGLWEGVIVANFTELPDADTPLMKKYRAAFEKYAAKDERWGVFFYAGMGFAEPLVEGLRRAGRNLTRQALVAELEKLRDFKGVLGRVSYQPFDPTDPLSRQGQREVFLTRCLADGKAERLTDWLTVE